MAADYTTIIIVELVLMSVIAHAVSGELKDTDLITRSHKMADTDHILNALCLHPTSTSKIYATADHRIIQFDWTDNSEIAAVDDVAGGSGSGKLKN